MTHIKTKEYRTLAMATSGPNIKGNPHINQIIRKTGSIYPDQSQLSLLSF
jgi:hypothetical protein